MATMTNEDLESHVNNLMISFHGDLTLLADAIGALNLGKIYGWKVLRIIYSPLTYKKYENVIGLEFNKVLPETTNYSKRSYGFQIVQEANKYWQAVSGQFKIDSKERRLAVS